MGNIIRIGTRESPLAVWQASQVKELLAAHGYESTLVFVKSEGDIDLITPLYEMGVQGIFTRSLDFALLNNRVDIAVHSLKDVPTQLPEGLVQAAVLQRGVVQDLLVYKGDWPTSHDPWSLLAEKNYHIATSSIRRKAQWLHRYPQHVMHNLRGNVNTRLRKLDEENWDGAIFAQAGLERINLRPANSIVIDWMLPAPAQGAVVVVCREADRDTRQACHLLNDTTTEKCTTIEREFLRTLLGGCSTPISALAVMEGGRISFQGNILSLDGSSIAAISKTFAVNDFHEAGKELAEELLANGGRSISESIRNANA
jgi:hydroxymethylbilane synthase